MQKETGRGIIIASILIYMCMYLVLFELQENCVVRYLTERSVVAAISSIFDSSQTMIGEEDLVSGLSTLQVDNFKTYFKISIIYLFLFYLYCNEDCVQRSLLCPSLVCQHCSHR